MATSPSPHSAPSVVPPPPRQSHSPQSPAPATSPPPWSSTPTTSPPHSSLTPSSPPPEPGGSGTNSPTTNVPPSAPPGSSSSNSTSPSPSPPPPSEEPVSSPPPPSPTASPPPDSASPPAKNRAPPPVTNSHPPPSPDPPISSPPPSTTPIPSTPPPSPDPPAVAPTTSSPNPPIASPPPQSPTPPSTSGPPQSNPPQISPPPADQPPQNSPPPSSQPPQTPISYSGSPQQDSAHSPVSPPPTNLTTPPSIFTPPPPLSPNAQPSHNSSATPLIPFSPPPPLGVSPPSPTQHQVPPSGTPTRNSSSPSSHDHVSTGVAVGIGVILGVLLLGAIGLVAWCTNKRRKRVAGMPTSVSSSPHTDPSLHKARRSPAETASRSPSEYLYSPADTGMGNSRAWFTYEALVEATNGFSEENLLGEGGFGRVYKGHLPDGLEVAVKQLKIGGGQGEREFKAEVETISRIHHRHLVSLAGYCISDSRRLLVYEYVPNNSLHFHLHGPDRPVMTWETRVKIAAGAARGIAYLHEDCLPRIIHRDIKSANILLDKNFEARVSDFGLAKLAADANSHVTTRVMGTFGYMAPEYASSGKLTEKSDVFSFGVVLLELITGRKPVDTSRPLGEESLVEWARPKLGHALSTEEFEDLVDPRLEKNYVENEMFKVIEAAVACVRHSATKRPTMGQVARAFESIICADLTNGMRAGESGIYNSAEQSAEFRLFQRMAFGSQDYSMDIFSHGSWQ